MNYSIFLNNLNTSKRFFVLENVSNNYKQLGINCLLAFISLWLSCTPSLPLSIYSMIYFRIWNRKCDNLPVIILFKTNTKLSAYIINTLLFFLVNTQESTKAFSKMTAKLEEQRINLIEASPHPSPIPFLIYIYITSSYLSHLIYRNVLKGIIRWRLEVLNTVQRIIPVSKDICSRGAVRECDKVGIDAFFALKMESFITLAVMETNPMMNPW